MNRLFSLTRLPSLLREMTAGAVAAAVCCAALGVFPGRAEAGEAASKEMAKPAMECDYPYDKGTMEVDGLGGAFASVTGTPVGHPAFDYELQALRFGYMLTNVKYSGFLRGNYEFLFEVFGGPVYQGPGKYLAGGAFQLRYNFVQPQAKLVPYAQIGIGALYSDAHTDSKQIELGSPGEFTEQFSLGLDYLLSNHWAFSLEGGFRHISDAGITQRNTGVNSLGGLAGLSYFF
jgi:lipid A 3-O-deacylase